MFSLKTKFLLHLDIAGGNPFSQIKATPVLSINNNDILSHFNTLISVFQLSPYNHIVGYHYNSSTKPADVFMVCVTAKQEYC